MDVRALLAGGLTAVAFLSSPAAQAKSAPSANLPCQLPGTDTATYLSLDPLPPAIKQALANELGDGKTIDMVPRDADFQETDLIESPDGPLSFHRFIQAGHSGARWYLWIEIGGLGFHYGLIVNEWNMGEKQARLVTEQQVLPADNLCSETLKHLNDPPAASAGG